MRLQDYWGVGPKTCDLLESQMGEEEAVQAIESGDVRALTGAGLPRGRATQILRHARGGKGLEVLATGDTREVYKGIVELASRYAVTRDAADRISVMTPLLSREKIERRLDRMTQAKESWESLDEETRRDILGAFEEYDQEGGGERAGVRVALLISETGVEEGIFSRLAELDHDSLSDAVDVLSYIDDGDVAQGAYSELDRLREMLGEVEDLEANALDILEEIRSGGARDVDEFRDAFVDYVVQRTDASYDRIMDATPDEAIDAADFVSQTLRQLASDLRGSVEEREE
ncbi:MAG: DNA mismatch repair protein, partial [Halobacteria archaeon]|nr:DNA mismatch repair protein [Halobacteria archaeon]